MPEEKDILYMLVLALLCAFNPGGAGNVTGGVGHVLFDRNNNGAPDENARNNLLCGTNTVLNKMESIDEQVLCPVFRGFY